MEEYIDYVFIFCASIASLFSGMAALYSKTRDEVTGKLKPWGKFLFIVILLGAIITGFSGIRQLQDDIDKHKQVVLAIRQTKNYVAQLEELTGEFRTESNSQINRISKAFSEYETASEKNLDNLKNLGESQIVEINKISKDLKTGLSHSADKITDLNTDLQSFSEKEAERFNKRSYKKIGEFNVKRKGKKVRIENELFVYLKEVGNDTGDVTIRIYQELYKSKKIEKFNNVGIKKPMIFKYDSYEYYIVATEAMAVESSDLNTIKLIVAKRPVIVSIPDQT